MIDVIAFHQPSIDDDEIAEVVATLRSGWLTTGPRTQQFETEFKNYVGATSALAVNSATAGLHLALAGLRIGPGDEVITTPLTFCSTINTILHVGATPVLADIGADGNIDPTVVAERITSRTRAILPVHLAGLPCDMASIWTLARSASLFVVEDAAHAVGSHYHGVPIGGRGDPEGVSDAVAYSFYATKNLTTGEGGMVTTHDPRLHDTMRTLCLHGISKDAWNRYSDRGSWYYDVTECGFKYNLSDIQSAIGIHQLRKQERFLERRAEIARAYNEAFADVAELELPASSQGTRHAWHLYGLRLNLELLAVSRDRFIQDLKALGVCASVHFIPIPLLSFFGPYADLPHNQCPRALALYPRLVSLPLYPAMTAEQVARVAAAVKTVVQQTKTRMSVAVADVDS